MCRHDAIVEPLKAYSIEQGADIASWSTINPGGNAGERFDREGMCKCRGPSKTPDNWNMLEPKGYHDVMWTRRQHLCFPNLFP